MSTPPTEATAAVDEQARPGRGELAALAALAVLGLLLRIGWATRVPFYDWDGGLFFGRIVEDLGSIFQGTADSQYGARHPVYNMMGFGVLVRVVRDVLGLSTEAAGQLVVSTGALAVLVFAWAFARRLAGPRAGLLAALFVAADPLEIAYSVQSYNNLPCAAFVLGAALLLVRSGPGGAGARVASPLVAGLLAGFATWLRADALAAGAVLAARSLAEWRRGRLPARSAVFFVGAWLVAAGATVATQRELMRRNGAADYLAHVHADAAFNTGQFPDAYHPDETGLTLRIASHPPSLSSWTKGDVAALLGASALELAKKLGPLLALAAVALVVLPAEKRGLGAVVGLLALAMPVFTVLALAPPVDMERYSIASRPLLLAVIAAGAIAALEVLGRREGTAGALHRRPAITAVATVAAVLAAWNPLPAALGLRDISSGVRARTSVTVEGLARFVPRRARVARGPGGDTILIALAGARPVHIASGSPAEIERYLRGNGLEWIVFAEAEGQKLAGAIPGVKLERVATYETPAFGRQVLARIKP